MMKIKLFFVAVMLVCACAVKAEVKTVASPDGKLIVQIDCSPSAVTYAVEYLGQQVMEPSALGVYTNEGDYTKALTLKGERARTIDENYEMRGTKASRVHYVANELCLDFVNVKNRPMTITFRVADNDIAFRYEFPQKGDLACLVVKGEATAFKLPQQTKTFICPQSDAMIGWMRTKPSYEEEYVPDADMNVKSKYGQGYTFPCLFRIPVATEGKAKDNNNMWVLVSETGVNGNYVGAHLSDYDAQKGYAIAFPMAGEANGVGTTDAGLALPGMTPWRTITVGASLAPIVETTVAYDVVEPLYQPKYDYKPGRYTWSWLIWQDNSINYNDQVQFIDLAAAMGFEYCLVDGCWDTNIGRQRVEELSRYAQKKGVHLLMWYNSNGYENDAPQTPKQCMNTTLVRRKEMAWLQRIGVKGIKVDFFAGDKQHTMQLYEDILADANDFGLQVIFHGCTLPRGWERMYPNYVSSEAVLASENTFFTEHHAKQEGFELTMHPFCRNAVAAMDWGGTIMNRYMSKDNKSRHRRYTTDVFEMAAAVVNQASVQCIAMQPNNLEELPQVEMDFLKKVPTAWDETVFIDGYPGQYVVLARRCGERWIVAGLNAGEQPRALTLQLPMMTGKTVDVYDDAPLKKGEQWNECRLSQKKVDKKGQLKVVLQPGGGLIVE